MCEHFRFISSDSVFSNMTRTYPTYHKSAETGTTGRAPTTAITGSAGRAPTKQPVDFAQPFCDFLTKNPTVFHAVHAIAAELSAAGYTKLSERDEWRLKQNSKYFLERNGSSLIAFIVGSNYDAGNGVAMIAGHVDALTAKLKPIAKLDTKAGYVQLGTQYLKWSDPASDRSQVSPLTPVRLTRRGGIATWQSPVA